MVKVAYILLCHGDVVPISRLVQEILRSDPEGEIVVHYDRRDLSGEYLNFKASFETNSQCHFLDESERVKGEWGTFSLVQAVINALAHIKENDLQCTHCYLISGTCFPIRPLSTLKQYLWSNPGVEFIECQGSEWIRGGIAKDRYLYHHFLPKRKYPKLFRWAYLVQKRLRLKRIQAESIDVRFGSQWWCLTWQSVLNILEYVETKRYFVKFFRTVWIPDECFFQTAINQLCNQEKIANKSLTYYEFDTNGRPRYFSEHEISGDILRNYFFIRKYN